MLQAYWGMFSAIRSFHIYGQTWGVCFCTGLAVSIIPTLLVALGLTGQVHEYVGRGNFLALYLAGGMLGALGSMYWFVLRGVLVTSHQGASGCVWALMTAWLYLRARFVPSHSAIYLASYVQYAHPVVVIKK